MVVSNIFIFTPILGEMIQFDEHIFQVGVEKPPTSNILNMTKLFMGIRTKFPRNPLPRSLTRNSRVEWGNCSSPYLSLNRAGY